MCDTCGTPSQRRVETATGRLVCQDCAADITASAAALLTGGSGLARDAGEAVAIRGWVRRLRALRSQRRAQRPGRRDH